MAHTALARKHRPRSFADVATQEHVSETLRRAVAGGRVGHAYLFCGPRGVGKTTLARVLAMALNCPDRTEEGEPCGVCESCTRIWGGHTALDVVEIDAASNRGVDDARDLRERAMYAPSGAERYKVYIVDEAHMLTREAWNALLKVLEEPPPRVIFVFATTEPQKIQQSAAPILSRCQRFDFRRIGVGDIVARLSSVLEREGAEAGEEALRLIARKADGGMRDALSLLDQVVSLTGGEVDAVSVRRVLGLVEEERYVQLLDVLASGRHADVFTLVEELVDEGYDLVEFHHGLLDMLRALLRLRLAPDAALDLQEDVRAQLAERAAGFEAEDIVRMLAAAADLEVQGSLRRAPNPRILIEMLLLRLSFLDRTVSLEELIGALGGAPTGEGGLGGGGGSEGPGASGAPGAGSTAAGRGAKGAATGAGGAARSAGAGGGTGTSKDGPSAGGRAAEAAHGSADPASPTAVSAAAAATASPTPPPAATPPPAGAASSAAGDTPGPTRAASPAEAWHDWLEAGRGVPSGMSALLRAATIRPSGARAISLTPLPGPAAERLQDEAVRDQIRRGLEPYLGWLPDLVVEEPPAVSAASRVTEDEVREDTMRALFRQEPRLQRAVEELDLELMD